jgi:hypothetical protein
MFNITRIRSSIQCWICFIERRMGGCSSRLTMEWKRHRRRQMPDAARRYLEEASSSESLRSRRA